MSKLGVILRLLTKGTWNLELFGLGLVLRIGLWLDNILVAGLPKHLHVKEIKNTLYFLIKIKMGKAGKVLYFGLVIMNLMFSLV